MFIALMLQTVLVAAGTVAAPGVARSGEGAVAAPIPVSVPRPTYAGAGQVCYFLLTDRFANGNPANDTGGLKGGAMDTGFEPALASHFHGGDLSGLISKLDYIKGLGATAVWVTPPFRNKPVQAGTAGYHGYWILDFLHIDPHLGTDAEFKEFVSQAHARGLKVYFDIIVNHTADVILYKGDKYEYIAKNIAPYRDADGRIFDEKARADNGLSAPVPFPTLSPESSFAYIPEIPELEKEAKNPAWLNQSIYYHNRGNSTFKGESALEGDFAGLDDVFTEHPDVVRGFTEIYQYWLKNYQPDGFRIDTVKHVNLDFWQAFAPAIRETARIGGRSGFVQFGEVMEGFNVPALSEFAVNGQLDAVLDFCLLEAMVDYVSKGREAAGLAKLFDQDDYYTGPANTAHSTITFLGNHDLGRFAYFLQRDNPGSAPEQLADLVRFGHGLLFLVRGQPVLYYGDEQGMIGRGGNDQQAREDMFPAQVPAFRDARLLGTTRTGADDKFDPAHPFYRAFRSLAGLRQEHPALSRGAMLVRPTGSAQLFAFSRIERTERIEYLAVFNNSRTETLTTRLPTSQPGGAVFKLIQESHPTAAGEGPAAGLTAGPGGEVEVTLAPLHYRLWRAAATLPVPAAAPTIRIVTPAPAARLSVPLQSYDGHAIPVRQEVRAEVAGGDGCAEVTFALERASRPGQYEILGTDDAAPYRLYWRPPPDLAPGETFTILATVDDLRGHRAATALPGLKLDDATTAALAAPTAAYGPRGATVPVLTEQPAASVTVDFGVPLTLQVQATGTGPLTYQWLRNGVELPGATEPVLRYPQASAALGGRYQVLVRGVAGSVLSAGCAVTVSPATAGRLETLPPQASRHLAQRRVDVWLPPGYDATPGQRYPVLYMHDGQNLFDPATSYGGVSWEVDQAACRLQREGRIPGVIIVGVWNNGAARFAEYMPRKAVTGEGLTLFPGGPSLAAATLQSDAYLRYLVQELKPLIDRTYRTLPEAAHTFIMGSSMGGLISAYAVAEYPGVFGGAGCVSTHWPAGDGCVVDYLGRHLPVPGAHRLYFDFGTETLDASYEPYQQRMDAALRAAGYTEGRDWRTRKFPGAEHSEKAWRTRVAEPLEFLLAP